MSISTCALPGCPAEVDKIVAGRGYCRDHRPESEPGPALMPCAVDGCGSPALGRAGGKDMCAYHAGRWPFPAAAAAPAAIIQE